MKKVRNFLCVVIALFLFAASFPIADFAIEANAATHKIVMTADEFINCLKIASARKNKYDNHYPNNLGYYNGSEISWDCWNLGKSIIWTNGAIVNNYSVGTYAKVDTSCGLGDWDGLTIVKQAPNFGSDFSNLVPGEWLYLNGHTGYYIGNGQVIECTGGSWGIYGITYSQIDSNGNRSRNGVAEGKWLYHGMVPWLDYTTNSEAKKLTKASYPSHCTIKVTENDKSIMSLPCSNKTNSKSDKVESAPKGTTYEAIGLILNTEDNLWYKVKAKNGKEGYIFAGNVSFVSTITSDITGPGISVPSNHTHGKTYVLTGSVNSSYNELTNVSAYVYSGSNKTTGGTASVNGKSYSLGRSAIDNQTEFNKLAVGQYTYKVTASYKSYYAKTDKTYGTKTGTVNVYSQTFNVVSGSVTPTQDTQKPTIINAYVSELKSTGYELTCTFTDNVGVTRAWFPTWTSANGQDDLVGREGTISGNTAKCWISTSDHNNEFGEYITHIYLYDAAGNNICHEIKINVSSEPSKMIYPTNGGIYKIAYGGGNNMYLDFALSGNNVQIYENCDGHSDPAFVKSQYFKLTHVGDGWYSIINIGNGKSVDIAGVNPTSGTNIQQWEYLGNNGQLYRFYDAGDGYCYIKSKLGTYVDKKDGDTSNDTNVWSYAFNGTVAQKWKLMLIEDIISTDESKSINNKHFTNAEKLSFSGWAFSNRGKSVTFKYVLDSSSPVTVKNCYRPDVKKVYSQSCAYTDVGYDFSIDLSELSVGKHTMKIIATSFFGTELVVSNLCFYVDEHSHIYLIIGYNPASCTLDGMQTSKCEICKDKKTVKINKLGHDYGDWITVKEATCTQTGIEQKTCKRCNNIQTQSIPETGHNYVSKVTTVATCKVSGVKTYTCQHNASHKKTENLGINASNHVNTKNIEEVKATCTTNGYTAGVYCNDCQKYVSGHKVIAKNTSNHVNTKNVAEVPATTESVGYTEGVYCNDCKKYISGHKEIPKLTIAIGDLDGDGVIKAADARLALRASVGLETLNSAQKKAADIDGNGTITAADARLILRASVGLEEPKEWLIK